jgi:tetratricopeptide (TPR) repeat protein
VIYIKYLLLNIILIRFNHFPKFFRLDEHFHKCYLNRATSLFHLGEFALALQDLEKLVSLINSLSAQEKEDTFYTKLILKSQIKSYAIYSILNDFQKSLGIVNSLINKENTFILGEKIMNNILKDKIIIEKRINLMQEKLSADDLFKGKDYQAAKEIYLRILSEDFNNEKILSNLSYIYFQEKDFQTCINYCSDVLKIIKNFREKINVSSKNYDNTLELKILLRRAESYIEINKMDKAQSDIETAERYEIRNIEIIQKFNLFKEKLKTILLENNEKQANEYLKNKQFSEALLLYEKSISLIKKKDRQDQLKFYLNRTSCLIALGQFENAIEECTRIHSALIKQKNIATINSNFEKIKILKDLEFNTLVKRAFAYSKSKKIEEAKADYKAALIINPTDTNIKRNLAALENIL